MALLNEGWQHKKKNPPCSVNCGEDFLQFGGKIKNFCFDWSFVFLRRLTFGWNWKEHDKHRIHERCVIGWKKRSGKWRKTTQYLEKRSKKDVDIEKRMRYTNVTSERYGSWSLKTIQNQEERELRFSRVAVEKRQSIREWVLNLGATASRIQKD